MNLNKLILDDMVQGIGEYTEAWVLLLLHPDREKIWAEAVKRREQLNRFCHFSIKWPKLVSTFKKTESFVKDSLNLPTIGLGFDNSTFLTATLNDSLLDSEIELPLDIEWGEEQFVELREAQQILFNVGSSVQIHYCYSEGEGWLTSFDSWDFQPNEGAVLLTFINTAIEEFDLELQINQANSVSKIILIPV